MVERIKRLLAMQEADNKELKELRDKRAAIVQASDDEGRSDLNHADEVEFRGYTEKIAEKAKAIEERQSRIDELVEEENRSDAAADALKRAGLAEARVHVTHEARTYEKGNGRSYLQDLGRAQMLGDMSARARLERHAAEVAVDPEYADLRKEYGQLETRDLTRTDGAGGYFVPPIYLVSEFEPLARAGRPTANLVTNLPLPPGTDSINVPAVATGTATAIQAIDNGAVQETDLTDTQISAGVKTVAGQQDVAIQALEQSPVAFDQIIFADLMADFATKVDVQVLNGSNGSGQVKGLLGATGINTTAYTDTSPTVAELYPKLASAINAVHVNRFLPPNYIIMHPTRWAWMLAALDSNNRPFIVPSAQGPTNAMGTFDAVTSQHVVGSILGLPVITDPSVPNTLGAGTNEDRIIIMRSNDLYLWESPIKTRVLPDVGSGNLTVRLQVYGYIAFTAERQPKSVSVVQGTGLTTPSF